MQWIANFTLTSAILDLWYQESNDMLFGIQGLTNGTNLVAIDQETGDFKFLLQIAANKYFTYSTLSQEGLLAVKVMDTQDNKWLVVVDTNKLQIISTITLPSQQWSPDCLESLIFLPN